MARSQLEIRNELVNWQAAPTEHEIANFDEPKIRYRQYVEDFINRFSLKSLKKNKFMTISTNVLHADLTSKQKDIDPIDRDIYLPLEIALVKWSVSDSGEHSLSSKVWIISPGKPLPRCNTIAMDHENKHLIDYTQLDNTDFPEKDLKKVMNEINSFLLPDRTVFSIELKHCRQDIGCLKWLNRETGYKSKPIKVLSLEDLFVVLHRKLTEDVAFQGYARYILEFTSNPYDVNNMCKYHKHRSEHHPDGTCGICAKAVVETRTKAFLDHIGACLDDKYLEPKASGS